MMRFSIQSCGAPWLLALAAAATVGCRDTGLPRGAVEGKVTIGGQPLKAGRIVFLPLESTQGPATSLAIADGVYQANNWSGPLVGTHRVEVEAALDLGFALDDDQAFAARPTAPLPPQPIPPAFNRNSKLTVTIEPGSNRYDIAIPSVASTAHHPN